MCAGPRADQPVEGRSDQRVSAVVADLGQHEQEGAKQVRRRRSGDPGRRSSRLPAAAAAAAAVA